MNQSESLISKDRMQYTKNTFSQRLIFLAILFDALFFVSIYQSDVGSFYYTMLIGASIIYNLVFLLMAFLGSEEVKNRRSGYNWVLIGMGIFQFVRIFIIPAKAHAAAVTVQGEEILVMGDGQYIKSLVYLGISGVCLIVAAVTSFIKNRELEEYRKSLKTQVK